MSWRRNHLWNHNQLASLNEKGTREQGREIGTDADAFSTTFSIMKRRQRLTTREQNEETGNTQNSREKEHPWHSSPVSAEEKVEVFAKRHGGWKKIKDHALFVFPPLLYPLVFRLLSHASVCWEQSVVTSSLNVSLNRLSHTKGTQRKEQNEERKKSSDKKETSDDGSQILSPSAVYHWDAPYSRLPLSLFLEVEMKNGAKQVLFLLYLKKVLFLPLLFDQWAFSKKASGDEITMAGKRHWLHEFQWGCGIFQRHLTNMLLSLQ